MAKNLPGHLSLQDYDEIKKQMNELGFFVK